MMTIGSLKAKAKKDTLEVEHITAAAKARLPGLNDELRRLSVELDWSNSTHLADGSHVVPLAKWAEVAGAYADGGMHALATLAQERQNAAYIIGLLEDFNSSEAVDALLGLYRDIMCHPSKDTETAWRLASAYNQLLSFKSSPIPTDTQARDIRSFLMALFPGAVSATQQACLVCALRGVGDQSTIDFLSTIDELPYPWNTVTSNANRFIRKRLRA